MSFIQYRPSGGALRLGLYHCNITGRWRFSASLFFFKHISCNQQGSGGNPGFTGANNGVSLNPAGYFSAYRTGGIVGYFGRSNDGKLFDFYRAGVACGDISISGSSTAFNTTSDRRLKHDLKPFDAKEFTADLF